jgi:hypothetical protein
VRCGGLAAQEVQMLLEETPSGNLFLYKPAQRDSGFKLTQSDIKEIAEVYALIAQWGVDEERSGVSNG